MADDAAALTPLQKISRTIASKFLNVQVTHKMSIAAATDMLDTVERLWDLLELYKSLKGKIPRFPVMRKLMADSRPSPKIELLLRKRDGSAEKHLTGLLSFPKKDYPQSEWDVVYEITSYTVRVIFKPASCCIIKLLFYLLLQIAEIISFHKKISPEHIATALWLCDDGVSPTNSSSKSLHVFCLHFEDCLNVYPILIFEAGKNIQNKNTAIDPMDLRRRVLKDLEYVTFNAQT